MMGYGLIKAGRHFAIPALLAVVMAACTPQGNDPSGRGQGGDGVIPAPRSAMAAFLGGRFAQIQGDNRLAADYYTAALKFDPDNEELLQRAFALSLSEGRMEQATQLAEHLLAYDADAPMALLLMGVQDVKAGRFEKAESRFTQIPKRSVFGILEPLLVAWTRQAQGQTDQALTALEPLGSMKGLAAIRAFHAALINDLAGRTDAAGAAYAQATSDQLAVRVAESASSFYIRQGQNDKAQDLFRRLSQDLGENSLYEASVFAAGSKTRPVSDSRSGIAEALFDLALLMRQSNAQDFTMVFMRLALTLKPEFPQAQLTMADMLAQQNRLADSIDQYRTINAASPLAAFGALRVALTLDEMGQTDLALQELDRLAPHPRLGIDALEAKADLLRSHKRFAEAVLAYDAVLNRVATPGPQHWMIYFGRAVSLERTQQWPRAEADFKKALELRPNHPDVLNYLGYSWVDQGINLAEGRAMIEKAVALRPRDGAIVDSLGWALYRMGETESAVHQLERAVELRPQDATINDHLGDAYWQVGRRLEAVFQWRRALGLDPEPDVLADLQKKLAEREAEAHKTTP